MDNNTIVIRKVSIFVADVNMCVSAKKKMKFTLTKFITFFLLHFFYIMLPFLFKHNLQLLGYIFFVRSLYIRSRMI